MGERTGYHRPLMAGIAIKGREPDEQGTLTGIATRISNGVRQKVLVTCLHVLAGGRLTIEPQSGLELYQLTHGSQSHKVGVNPQWVPIHTTLNEGGEALPNYADVAFAELADGINDSDTSFKFHGTEADDHDGGIIVPGVREPAVGDEMKVVGAHGTYRAIVGEVGKSRDFGDSGDIHTIGKYWNIKGLAILNILEGGSLSTGDSGAACLYYDEDVCAYRMSAILISGNPDTGQGTAFPASVAERELKIEFGDPELGGVEMGKSWVIDEYFQAR